MISGKKAFFELANLLYRDKIKVFSDSYHTMWLIQTKNGWQIALMEFKKEIVSCDFHVNDCSQWGIVLRGAMSLWLSNKKKQILRKGDMFSIPKGMPHRVNIKAGYQDVTVFNGQRYKLNLAKG